MLIFSKLFLRALIYHTLNPAIAVHMLFSTVHQALYLEHDQADQH
jgi:hypothetical protein